MTKPIEISTEQAYKCGRPWLSMRRAGSYEYPWREGLYWHPRGLIAVFSSPRDKITDLRFVEGGRVYGRSFARTFTDRTISRLCREFIEEDRS